MPALQSPQEFVTAVRRGRVVDAARLKAFVAGVRGQSALTARRVADRAVADGLLTRFQADEVLAGRADELVLADYRLLARLGEGGSGDVYLAEHTPTGERRAVKVLHGERADDPVAHTRFSREAAAVAQLSHPNLVKVFEHHPGGPAVPPFLAMEYVDGVSLQAAVALAGTFTAEAAAECGRQAADALQHAWDAGLVHRDVKPANLLVTRRGVLKVLDFGLVRLSRGDSTHTLVSGRRLLGTAAYAAPEQITDGSAVDCRADVYALGGTLYFLLAGQPPFDTTCWIDGLQGKLTGDPRPIHHLRPDVPDGLSAVIAAMLARHPDDRPPTPAEAARLLAPWSAPAFAPALFARLDRTEPEAETPRPNTPTAPAPTIRLFTPARPQADPSSDFELHPQTTVRMDRPTLVRLRRPPARSLWWLPAAVVVGGLAVVLAAVVLAVVLSTK